MNILFDATILANGLNKNGTRSGIYMVAYNLLSQFRNYKDVNISLYCSAEKYQDFLKLEDETILKFPIYSNKSFISLFFYNISSKIIVKKGKYLLCEKVKIKIKSAFFKLAKMVERKKIPELSKEKIQVYFSPMNAIPKCIRKSDIKSCVIIIYDMIPYILPDYKAGLNGWFGDVMKDLNKNDFYFVISESAKQDFIRIKNNKIDINKVYTTYIGVSDSYHYDNDETKKHNIIKKYGIKTENYVFSLGSIEPRKNLKMQIKAFVKFINKNQISNLTLIIGGGKYSLNLIDELKQENIDVTHIQYIGYVDDADLCILYSNALWFTFTSKYEGFGLPPLEAMKCGCPVIASNNSSLPEVCGDAALLIDCNNLNEHIIAYEKFYNNSHLRKQFQGKGFSQVVNYDWKDVSKRMISIMEKISNY